MKKNKPRSLNLVLKSSQPQSRNKCKFNKLTKDKEIEDIEILPQPKPQQRKNKIVNLTKTRAIEDRSYSQQKQKQQKSKQSQMKPMSLPTQFNLDKSQPQKQKVLQKINKIKLRIDMNPSQTKQILQQQGELLSKSRNSKYKMVSSRQILYSTQQHQRYIKNKRKLAKIIQDELNKITTGQRMDQEIKDYFIRQFQSIIKQYRNQTENANHKRQQDQKIDLQERLKINDDILEHQIELLVFYKTLICSDLNDSNEPLQKRYIQRIKLFLIKEENQIKSQLQKNYKQRLKRLKINETHQKEKNQLQLKNMQASPRLRRINKQIQQLSQNFNKEKEIYKISLNDAYQDKIKQLQTQLQLQLKNLGKERERDEKNQKKTFQRLTKFDRQCKEMEKYKVLQFYNQRRKKEVMFPSKTIQQTQQKIQLEQKIKKIELNYQNSIRFCKLRCDQNTNMIISEYKCKQQQLRKKCEKVKKSCEQNKQTDEYWLNALSRYDSYEEMVKRYQQDKIKLKKQQKQQKQNINKNIQQQIQFFSQRVQSIKQQKQTTQQNYQKDLSRIQKEFQQQHKKCSLMYQSKKYQYQYPKQLFEHMGKDYQYHMWRYVSSLESYSIYKKYETNKFDRNKQQYLNKLSRSQFQQLEQFHKLITHYLDESFQTNDYSKAKQLLSQQFKKITDILKAIESYKSLTEDISQTVVLEEQKAKISKNNHQIQQNKQSLQKLKMEKIEDEKQLKQLQLLLQKINQDEAQIKWNQDIYLIVEEMIMLQDYYLNYQFIIHMQKYIVRLKFVFYTNQQCQIYKFFIWQKRISLMILFTKVINVHDSLEVY